MEWFLYDRAVNSFLSSIPILYPRKTPENIWFSSVFRGYKMATLAKNGLMKLHFSYLTFLIERMSYLRLLTYFRSLFTFYYPWKHKETRVTLMFSGGIKRQIGLEWLNLFQDNVFLCLYAAASCSGNVCTKIEFIKRREC